MQRRTIRAPGPHGPVERSERFPKQVGQRARIAFVTPVTPSLEERSGFASRLHDLLTGLIQVADVDLFLPREAESKSPEAIGYWRGFDAVTIHLVLESRPPARSPILYWALRARHHMFELLPTWSSTRRSPELARHLREGRADALCLHLPGMAHLAAMAPADVPVIAMLEEGLDRYLFAPSERSWLRRLTARAERSRVRRLYRRTSKRAAIITAISTEEAALLSAGGVDPDRIVVVPHGVDPSYFAPEQAPAEPEFDVTVFGDFRFERNLAPALEAARWAAGHHPCLRWAFVGDIHSRDADALRATGATVTGRVADMRPHYGKTKVVLVPAIAGTGVKTTLLQAWAMGKPVVATPQSARGVPAAHGVNLLIGCTTPELVAHCVHLSMSPELRDDIAARGRKTVVQDLDVREIASRFASLVTSLVAASARTGGSDKYV